MSSQYSYCGCIKPLYDALITMYNNPIRYRREEREENGMESQRIIDREIEEPLEAILGVEISEPYQGVESVHLSRWNVGYWWYGEDGDIAVKPLPKYDHNIDGVSDGDDGVELVIDRGNMVETFTWQTTIDEEEEERKFRTRQLKKERLAKEEKQKTDIDKLIEELQKWRKLFEQSL